LNLFQNKFGDLDLPYEKQSMVDFKMIDENDDGILTMEEWRDVVGC
jgi:hypothetical protein